uniref:Uncharacterized protein n=1 Tax=Chromera velia CCMP2878 TaxID=1169474 RepID=A0A0G4GDF5_9ALVE|eukprot:Cvel_4537.t1-p1 / transcript=Cvel_4537.t1 / gene=Cvel_4537 / organism=Chromera_velia_CCMP2878 / gene_product=hypothetical protein / transcript_product=hypothetical protein / location=Cvel_scaffold199:6887-9772(+) / protein_length=636 / sequence_SO=supercontig / SO=protein_coding / is_pseudo=false
MGGAESHPTPYENAYRGIQSPGLPPALPSKTTVPPKDVPGQKKTEVHPEAKDEKETLPAGICRELYAEYSRATGSTLPSAGGGSRRFSGPWLFPGIVENEALRQNKETLNDVQEILRRAQAFMEKGKKDDDLLNAIGCASWSVPDLAWVNKVILERRRRTELEGLCGELKALLESNTNREMERVKEEEEQRNDALETYMKQVVSLKNELDKEKIAREEAESKNDKLQDLLKEKDNEIMRLKTELSSLHDNFVNLKNQMNIEMKEKEKEKEEAQARAMPSAMPNDTDLVHCTTAPQIDIMIPSSLQQIELQLDLSQAAPFLSLPDGDVSPFSRHLAFFHRYPKAACNVKGAELAFLFPAWFAFHTCLYISPTQLFKDVFLSQRRLKDYDGQRAVYDEGERWVYNAREGADLLDTNTELSPIQIFFDFEKGVFPEDLLRLLKEVGAIEMTDEFGDGWADGQIEWEYIEELIGSLATTCKRLVVEESYKSGNEVRAALSLGGLRKLVQLTLEGDDRKAVARNGVKETAARVHLVHERLPPLLEGQSGALLGRQRFLAGRVAEAPFLVTLKAHVKNQKLCTQTGCAECEKPEYGTVRYTLVAGFDERDEAFILKEAQGLVRLPARVLVMAATSTFSLFLN